MIFPRSRYPYTSYTNINLDWIMRKLKNINPAGLENPVSYDAQSPTPEEQQQARDNIGIAYPVDSVNGQTGTVVLTATDVGALPDSYTPPGAPVDSVNGQTGTVVLTATDVGALPDSYTPPAAPVDSVNGNTGAVVRSFGDVGAIGIYKGPNATAGGTAYDLTGTDYNNFLIIVGSPNGANNNTILYANLTYDKIRLLGNVASDLTVSISSGIVTIASANYQANVWICPLTD